MSTPPLNPTAVQRTKGDTFSVNEHQGFFGQQAAQVELDGAVPAIADVQVRGSASLLWQKSCQVRCIADAQFFDVCRTIRIHWIRADFFRRRNIRASDDHLHFRLSRHAGQPPEMGHSPWPNEIEARSKGIPAMLHPAQQMNGRLMTGSFR